MILIAAVLLFLSILALVIVIGVYMSKLSKKDALIRFGGCEDILGRVVYLDELKLEIERWRNAMYGMIATTVVLLCLVIYIWMQRRKIQPYMKEEETLEEQIILNPPFLLQ